MQQGKLFIGIMIMFFVFVGCLPIADERSLVSDNSHPPVLLEVVPVSPYEIAVHFDKPCTLPRDHLVICPELEIEAVSSEDTPDTGAPDTGETPDNRSAAASTAARSRGREAASSGDTFGAEIADSPDGQSPGAEITDSPEGQPPGEETPGEEATILITLAEPQAVGKEYFIEAVAEDEGGNSMSFITPFYGYNPHVPELLINEFTTQGSGNHPDLVELFITSNGNMAGVTIFEGSKEEWDDRLVFPSRKVEKGDFILVHFKPEGIEEEVNELAGPAESGGKDASDNAYDFWVEGGAGLSGNNGVLSVYTTPRGEIIDGVLYSNRTSSSDEKYRGFGTKKVMLWADQLADDGGWNYAGDLIAPEDGINPDDSTGTRSMCRSSNPSDTDTKQDWHIVPTSTSTFGGINSDEVYTE